MSDYKVITEAKDLKGKKVLLRLDLNVPLDGDSVLNDYRIKTILPTIDFLKNEGARIIILSHIGREKEETLKPVSDFLQNIFEHKFINDIYDDTTKVVVEGMSDGEIILFENLRKYDGEKSNDPLFVDFLASFGDIYVNEAFSNSHRKHSSMVGITNKLPHYAGIRFDEEVKQISKSFNPPDPFLLIVGGAKFETKLPLVKKFTNIANMVFLGGALSNDVYRYNGYSMNSSVVSDTPLEEIEALINTTKVIVPADVIVEDGTVKLPREVLSSEMVVDAGPRSVEILSGLIRTAKLIIWNGPLGFYEKGFTEATDAVAKKLIESNADVIIGGGDILSAVSKFEYSGRKVFASTAGGAMLDFLSNKTLPALEALKD